MNYSTLFQLFNLKHLTSGAIVDFSSNLMDVKFHRISAITVFHRTDKVKTKRSIIFMQELIEILLLKSLLFGNVRKECGGRFYTHWLTSYLSNLRKTWQTASLAQWEKRPFTYQRGCQRNIRMVRRVCHFPTYLSPSCRPTWSACLFWSPWWHTSCAEYGQLGFEGRQSSWRG